MSWAGNVADMGKMTNGNKPVVRKPERKDCEATIEVALYKCNIKCGLSSSCFGYGSAAGL
jgi:hypothetical protein